MKNLKKLMSILLTLCLTAALICMPALAATDGDAPAAPKLEGAKTATPVTGEPGKYTVEVFVPGADPDNRHDEVILMVDGSYSLDNEWPAMKEAINTIAETVLNGTGSTQLTLMAFGMGDNIVLEHVKDTDELAAALGELPGYLLYGRSSTNCEAGFNGVANYIANHDETLKDAYVIYISDGRINTDETPAVFHFAKSPWNKSFTLGGAMTGALEYELKAMQVGAAASTAFTEVFGADADPAAVLTDLKDIVKERHADWDIPISVDENSDFYAKVVAWAEKVYADVFAAAGLELDGEYPVSVVERAFVTYDNKNGTYIQEAFYNPLMGRSYPNRGTRTPAAAEALAAMDQVAAMYVVDYDSYTAWMDTGITNEKSIFVQSSGIAGLCQALEGALAQLAGTPFNDVTVTDYMSKWVNIDLDSLRIVDRSTDTVIWNAKEGWKIDEGRPTAQEVPVTAEKVDPADYEAGGADVIGNKIGDIYKLTWRVKDGALLRSDGYVLQYEVAVDDAEPGFRYDTDYPANGNTFADYIDQNQQPANAGIDVPEVIYNDPNPQPDPEPVYYHNITINYFDKNTGAAVAPSYVTAFEEGTVYDVSAQNGIAVSGYTWDSTDRADLLTGTLTGDVVINVYYVEGEVLEIPELPTPLQPSAPTQDETIIDETDIPLADVPATGDPLTVMAAMSVLSAAGVYFTGKKRDEE